MLKHHLSAAMCVCITPLKHCKLTGRSANEWFAATTNTSTNAQIVVKDIKPLARDKQTIK